MREWIPISTSPKGRLALAAVAQFGARPFDAVTVGELAAAAEVTTGAIYHHFGSKLGLYDFVRDDVEQRLLDRMEGAIAASAPSFPSAADRSAADRSAADRSAAVMGALVVGFDFAVREGFVRILGDPPARAAPDRVAALLRDATAPASPVLGEILAAAWRAALVEVAEGVVADEVRAALLALEFRPSS